eukprot:16419-Amorphochlora_amoeboformis.AAC.1
MANDMGNLRYIWKHTTGYCLALAITTGKVFSEQSPGSLASHLGLTYLFCHTAQLPTYHPKPN